MIPRPHRSLAALLLAASLGLGACTDETVYVDREPFNPPVDAASGFLGYYTSAAKQTTCGNCHVSTQSQWAGSKHAKAWAGLQTAGAGVQTSCYGCHGVSARGNKVTGTAGIDFKADSTYYDVQCESCHGAGLNHVTTPDNRATWPYAYAHLNDTLSNCASCHSGSHEPYYGQWKASAHAVVTEGMTNPGSPAYNTSCNGCHEGNVALARIAGDPYAKWLEKDSTRAGVNAYATTCAVCHDPHGSPYTGQLRRDPGATELTTNLCMMCHNRAGRENPASNYTNGSRAVHAAQGATLLGSSGWIPPGYALDTIRTTHTSTSTNPKLCAGCHVARFTVTTPGTGNFAFQSVGHLFSPNPCVDAQGIPNNSNSCAYTGTARNWSGCLGSGCHASGTVAANLLVSTRASIRVLLDQLWVNSNQAPVGSSGLQGVQANDGGMLAQIIAQRPTEFSSSTPLTAAEGALFNTVMLSDRDMGINQHNDGSFGIHNVAYYRALLAATITELRRVYPAIFPAPLPADVQVIIDEALSQPGVRYTPPAQQVSSR